MAATDPTTFVPIPVKGVPPGVLLLLRSLRVLSSGRAGCAGGSIGAGLVVDATAALIRALAGVCRGLNPPVLILARAACGLIMEWAGALEASLEAPAIVRAGFGVSIPRIGIVDDSLSNVLLMLSLDFRLGLALNRLCGRWIRVDLAWAVPGCGIGGAGVNDEDMGRGNEVPSCSGGGGN